MKSAVLFALSAVASCVAMANESITVVSYGGSLATAQIEAAHKPFAKESGIKVISEDYSGGIAQVKAQVDTNKITWDVVDMELPNAVRACNAGLLERIDPDKDLAPGNDGKVASQDFIPGALSECGVASIVWSTAVAYNTKAFKNGQPTALKDFFDLQRFPGKRSLRKAPQVNLEWALLADGVPREEVYATLETDEGLERAFAKLDTIKDQVVWWEAGAQPPQLLADGEVVMTSAYNGRIYDAQVKEKQPFQIIWDGQMYDMDVWTVPKGTPKKEQAMAFLRFATQSSVLADQSKYIAYGPTRQSSQPLVSEEVKPHLPTTDANFATALQVDSEWWADHADELSERFNAWLAK
ncbi:ABC transporter substrate-binding protein [Pseudomonas sp. CR3202]|uniref:ABC transporter substrate-binding protein n=1 Tax=Pseudomonas sp. CR3202 TaxID=3351532 RepID=UPI003BF21435